MSATSNVAVSQNYFSRFLATFGASLVQLVRAPSHSRRAEAARRSARHVLWLAAGIGMLTIALMYGLDASEIRLMPHFVELHTLIWSALRDEVQKAHAHSLA